MTAEIKGDTIVSSVDIAAAPEAVYDALVDPLQLRTWWGADEMYRTLNWKMDLRVGGAWSCEARGATGQVSHVAGTIVEVDRPRVLAYTWNPSWEQIPETTVRFTLEPISEGTRLRVVHSGFAGHRDPQARHAHGRALMLRWLVAFFDTERK